MPYRRRRKFFKRVHPHHRSLVRHHYNNRYKHKNSYFANPINLRFVYPKQTYVEFKNSLICRVMTSTAVSSFEFAVDLNSAVDPWRAIKASADLKYNAQSHCYASHPWMLDHLMGSDKIYSKLYCYDARCFAEFVPMMKQSQGDPEHQYEPWWVTLYPHRDENVCNSRIGASNRPMSRSWFIMPYAGNTSHNKQYKTNVHIKPRDFYPSSTMSSLSETYVDNDTWTNADNIVHWNIRMDFDGALSTQVYNYPGWFKFTIYQKCYLYDRNVEEPVSNQTTGAA